MRGRRMRKLAGLGLVLFLALALTGPSARGQDDDQPFEEPGIDYREHSAPYIQWLVGSLLVAACLFVAFKNPHRSHLD